MTHPWIAQLVGTAVLLGSACHGPGPISPVSPDSGPPPELEALIGEGVGLDRFVALTRELGATSEFFVQDLGFDVMPGQVFSDGFAVHYIYFHERPLFEIQSIYDKELALETWGDTEVRFLEARQGGFLIGIGVSDIPRARRRVVDELGLPEHRPLGAPAQASFDGPQEPYENKSAVILGDDLPARYQDLAPIYFTNYTHVARQDGREKRPEERHPAQRESHPNTATRIAAVYLAVDDLDEAVAAYRDLGFTRVLRGEHAAWGARSATLDAACADLVLLEPARAGGRVDRFLRARGQAVAPMGGRIGVRDLDQAQSLIEHNTGISLVRYDIDERAGFLVPPERTSDVFVEFVQD